VISATRVARALAHTRRSPGADFAPEPDQTTLEVIQATLTGAAA
jgi:hypothetical protein